MGSTNPQFNLRLDPELKAWLDAKARETRLSRTWCIFRPIVTAHSV